LGLSYHTEVKIARRIAKILGLHHTLLTPRGELLDRIPVWLEALQGQAGFGTVYITELLDRGYPFGTPVLHGLIGGNLVWGAYFSTHAVDESMEGIARFLVSRALRGLDPDYAETLGLSVEFDARVEEMSTRLIPAEATMQTFLMWDLENRQPRGTGAQMPYLGQEYRAGAPFYDRRQIEAWMSIPRMGLETRDFLRKLFQSRYPEVASMPHAEEYPERLPNNLASFQHLMGHLTRRVGDGILRRIVPGYDRWTERRYIWGKWHRRTKGEIARQEKAMEENRGIVEDVLGWSPEETGGEDFWNRISTTPQRAEGIRTSYYLLTEYCDWLKRATSAVRPDS
jgi:hypothetical protein